MAELASELAIKIADTERWPKEFQGGRVTELLKKGSPLQCDDHRNILLEGHLAKLVLREFLNPIKPVYEARLPAVQMGAVSKRDTDFGTHMLTSVIESRTGDNDEVGICFVDLVKAFDRVLRDRLPAQSESRQGGRDLARRLGSQRPLFERWERGGGGGGEGGEGEGGGGIRKISYFRSCESPVSIFTKKIIIISGIQIAIEAINTTAISRQRR